MLFAAPGFLFAQQGLVFTEKTKKFDKVDEGIDVVLNYEFTNQGSQAVVINEAKVSCSCTEVSFPKEVIAPQKGGSVAVTFRTKGKIGYQERKIEIISTSGTHILLFKGVVRASGDTKKQFREKD